MIQPPLSRLLRACYQVALVMTGAYGLSVAGFLALRGLVGESWWMIAVMNSFVHLLYLPAWGLLPLWLVLRRLRVAVLLLVPIGAFIVSYGELFTPRPVSAAPAQALSLLTYNLKSETAPLAELAQVIVSAGADVVALQEVSEAAAAHFALELAALYPHQAHHAQFFDPVHGQSVLSRYPIIEDEFWLMYLGHQRVTLDINGQPVALYNTHTIHPFTSVNGFRWRAEEIDEVLYRAAAEAGPVIIAGDFNMSDQSEDYARVASRYTDSYRSVGWGLGFTFPRLFDSNALLVREFGLAGGVPPLARLDYVFHNDHFISLEARVWPESGGSDHYPVYVELGILE